MFKKLLCAAAAFTFATTAFAQDNGPINLSYVQWSSEIASTNVLKAVLEKEGFTVNITPLSVGVMYQAVANGQSDGMVSAWLPTTQKDYYEKLKDKLVNLGPNLEGTKLGLVVPQYTYDAGVKSIGDLEANADKFDGKIVGIDPGAGEMALTEQVVKDYGLNSMELQSSSGAIMTAALDKAIKQHKDIVVTGWTPHWMFARYKLQYLADPKNIYGDKEEIDTLVRKGFEEDHPKAYKIIDQFKWTPADMEEVMLMNLEKGTTPAENAKKWIDAHPDLVAEWTK